MENEILRVYEKDIIGSPFEFDRGDKIKDFELFSKGCRFRDWTYSEESY